MILVGIGIRVSVFVAVGRIEGDCGLELGFWVGKSIRGISSEVEDAASVVSVAGGVLSGLSDTVPLGELEGVGSSVGTSCSVELAVEGLSSDTGIPVDVGSRVSGVPLVLGGTESVPDAVPVEGNIPGAVSEVDGGGAEVGVGRSVGMPPDDPLGTLEGTTSVGVGRSVGMLPDDSLGTAVGSEVTGISVGISVGTSVGITEERDSAMLDRMVEIGTGAVPVGWISEKALDAMLDTKLDRSGICVGRSVAMEDTMLEISEIKEGMTGVGETPGVVVGAVGPTEGSVTPGTEVGTMPELGGSSETIDERGGSAADSDVGIGTTSVDVGGVGSPVPRAVVIPTKIPVPELEIAGEEPSEDG